MPHSSGGGSSGGGFSSGSSHSGPSYRTSTRYFPGAVCYAYYTPRGRLRTIYTNNPNKPNGKGNVAGIVIMSLMMAVGLGIFLYSGYHHPTKLNTDYSTTIVIQDDQNVMTAEEEATLKATFDQFFTVSGICPSVLTVDNGVWNTHYASLQGYAYDAYINRFKDESHWLIVYSDDNATGAKWAFEGMQGNNTDNILTQDVTKRFNESVYNSLTASKPVAASLNDAFNLILPNLMDTTFKIQPGMWAFIAIWEGALTFALVSTIVNMSRNKGLQNAVRIEASATKAPCPNCGNLYIPGTVARCPKCGALLNDSIAPKI